VGAQKNGVPTFRHPPFILAVNTSGVNEMLGAATACAAMTVIAGYAPLRLPA